MNIAITGATGFVGAAAVRAALAQGHRVKVLLRRGRPVDARQPWSGHAAVSIHATGLQDSPELVDALGGVDTVVHVAAALSGTYEQQRADSVDATTQLLQGMRKAGVRRLVGISSFSVYDYVGLPRDGVLDETSPLEAQPLRRTAYARVKLEQESLFRAFGEEPGGSCVVLRPGLVYDAQRLWMPALGRGLGAGRWLAMGPDGVLPLVHVDDVASAIVLAAASRTAGTTVFNLVEDEPPRRRELLDVLGSSGTPSMRVVGFPWPLQRALAGVASAIFGLLGRRAPGLVDPVELAVRFKPLRYDNARARTRLGWQPQQHALAVARLR